MAVDGDERAAVRATFDFSYAALSEPARQLFGLLGLVPGPDVTAEVAAALVDGTTDDARALLDQLAAAHLIERVGIRYSFHDLLRLYAAAHAEHNEATPGALARLYDCYLHTARAALTLLNPDSGQLDLPERTGAGWSVPGFADSTSALSWMDTERHNLVAAVLNPPAHVPPRAIWLLTDALRGFLYVRSHLVELGEVARAGLAAARAGSDLQAQSMAHLALAMLYMRLGDNDEVIEQSNRALDAARRISGIEADSFVSRQIAGVHSYLGKANRMLGRVQVAIDHHRTALEVNRRSGWKGGQFEELVSLGYLYWDTGRLARAVECAVEILALAGEVGSGTGRADAHGILGNAYLALGRLDDAREHLTRSLALYRDFGALMGESSIFRALAQLERAMGQPVRARELAALSLAMANDKGYRRNQSVSLNVIAELDRDEGAYEQAAEKHRQARDLARVGGVRYSEIEAMIGLAVACGHLDRHDEALGVAGEALAGAVESEFRALAGYAHAALAEIHLARGATGPAGAEAERALAILDEIGHRTGAARATALLALARR